MRVPPRLLAVVLFVSVGMIALCVAGLLDWIVGVLFLTMEFLGEAVRTVFRRKEHRHPPARHRLPKVIALRDVEGQRASIGRRGRPRRRRLPMRANRPTPSSTDRRLRVLVPVSGDEADLLDYAVEECRARQAEMILLYLRPMAITPMGPVALPGLAEDDEARSTFDRLRAEADRVGVPLRAIYTTTNDRTSTITKVASTSEADLVIVAASRRGGLSRFLTGDTNRSLLKKLPERVSLTYFSPNRARPCLS